MKFLDHLHHPEKYFKIFLKWGLLGLLMGLIGGFLGAVFHHALHGVTEVRGQYPWLIFLLPVGGLLIIGLYRVLRLRNNRGTNEIIDAILSGEPVNRLISPVIFTATAITHLFGGSAGREGAALQIGGSTASALAELLSLKEKERTVLIMSGMSAVFAGLFGTPLTATLFTMEFVSVGTIFSPALLPCYLAAFTASSLSGAMGVTAETVVLEQTMSFTAATNAQILVLAMGIGILGIAMCYFFHETEHLAKKWIPNDWLRITLGAAVILILTKFGVSEFSAPVFITIVVISAVCLVLSLVYLVFVDKNKPSEETPLRETEIKTERKNFWICAAVGIAVCVLTWLLVLVTGM